MKTITIQIGNSDNKLTQQEWSAYVLEMAKTINKAHALVHFSGFSQGDAPWQNAAWVIEYMGDMSLWIGAFHILKERVSKVGKKYNQESVAWTVGDTEFI